MTNSSTFPSGAQIEIEKPFGRVFGLALVFMLVIVVLAEAVSRIGIVQRYFSPLYSVGSTHEQFELKLVLLEQFVEKHKSLDCLIIGSSEAEGAINPEGLNLAFLESTGKEIHCFNFALPGAGLPTLVPLGQYLVETYQPKLVIFGNSIHGHGDNFGDSTFQEIGQNPWLLYKTSNFNLEGWLLEHSFAYRSYLTYRNWMSPDFRSQIEEKKNLLAVMSPEGYLYQLLFTDLESLRIPPDPAIVDKPEEVNEISDPIERQWRMFEITLFIALENYKVSPQKLDMLSKLLELKSQTQFIVIEIPLHPTFFAFYSDPQDYDRAANILEKYFEEKGVEFWRATEMIPDEGWRDRNHMNYLGAEIFSTWLGERLGQAVLDGWISAPTE